MESVNDICVRFSWKTLWKCLNRQPWVNREKVSDASYGPQQRFFEVFKYHSHFTKNQYPEENNIFQIFCNWKQKFRDVLASNQYLTPFFKFLESSAAVKMDSLWGSAQSKIYN